MKNLFIMILMINSIQSFSQCEILNRILPDGSMLYYMQPVNFYWTKAKDLKGCVVTDKENYFVGLRPTPFPEKPLGNKLNNDIELTLSNGKVYKLSHYDTRYMENDTIMELLFLIDKKDLNDILQFEAISVTLDMMDKEGKRSYIFKLHKKALQEQLACFLKQEEERKKK